jgi:hypothetical protein
MIAEACTPGARLTRPELWAAIGGFAGKGRGNLEKPSTPFPRASTPLVKSVTRRRQFYPRVTICMVLGL